jgi:GntR family transcriptional regulator
VHEADSNRPDGTGTSGRKPLKYRRIADDLRSGIRRGDYEPGRPLPGENDLMARYKVARMTVRQALAELQREGLAIARRGSGVYVSDLRPIVRDELGWLATMPWLRGEASWKEQAAGAELQVEGLGVRLDRAAEAVAEALELPPGAEVWARSGRSALEGRTVALTVSWLPRALVEGTRATAPDPGPGGIYGCLAALGLAPTNSREDVRARPAIPVEAEQLALSAGAPVLVVRRLARAGARPVELSESVLDASVHVLRYELPAGSEPTLSRG